MMRGKLIVLSGIDGSGKTVQTKLLYERLLKEGYRVEVIDYPRYGETFFGELVGRYLRGEFGKLDEVSPYLAAVLFAGDRFETRDRIEGWLAEGKIVLANRYVADNIAHQGVRVGGSDLEMEKFTQWLTRLEYEVFKMPRADMNILLSLPPAIAHKLVVEKKARDYLGGKKRDIHEDDLPYLTATSKYFHELALQPDRTGDWRIVECEDDYNLLSEAFISERIWDCMDAFLKIGNTDATNTKAVPAFKPGTMAALRMIDNWDGLENHNYVLAKWCEHEGEMQWCHWPHGGRVIECNGDEILDIWVIGKSENIDCIKEMSREEKSLLLYLETCATDKGGRVDARHINIDDMAIAKRWNETGFVRFGRIASELLPIQSGELRHPSGSTHWCELSEEAWRLAHAERMERYKRLYSKRNWRTTEEKRAVG